MYVKNFEFSLPRFAPDILFGTIFLRSIKKKKKKRSSSCHACFWTMTSNCCVGPCEVLHYIFPIHLPEVDDHVAHSGSLGKEYYVGSYFRAGWCLTGLTHAHQPTRNLWALLGCVQSEQK